MKTYFVKEIPAFVIFRKNIEIRDALIQQASNKVSGILAIAALFERQIIFSYGSYSPEPNSLIEKLIQYGYTREQICYSLAEAWVNNTDTFNLPNLGIGDRFGKRTLASLASIIITIVLILMSISHFYKQFPNLIANLLTFGPLLSLAGLLLAWILYEFFMWLWER
jgi:hypothetical protein